MMTIRSLMKQRGLKGYWVATEIGMKPGAFQKVAAGKNRLMIDKAPQLARTLGVSVADIVEASIASLAARDE